MHPREKSVFFSDHHAVGGRLDQCLLMARARDNLPAVDPVLMIIKHFGPRKRHYLQLVTCDLLPRGCDDWKTN